MRKMKKGCVLALSVMMIASGVVTANAASSDAQKFEYVKGSKQNCVVEVVSESPIVVIKVDNKELPDDGKTVLVKAVEESEAPVTSESPATSEAPAATSEAPAATSEAPAATTEAPAATTEAPYETTEAPYETTEAPMATSEAPAATSEAPAATSEAPAATSEAPAVTSEAPAATSEAPAYTSEAPMATGYAMGNSMIPVQAYANAEQGEASAASNTYVVSFDAEYLDTLSVGEHTVTFTFADTTTKDVVIAVKAASVNSPEAGETTMIFALVLMVVASGAVITFARRKKTA